MLPAGLAVMMILISLLLGLVTAKILKIEKYQGGRTLALTAGVQNYGFLGIPILFALYHDERTQGVFFAFALGIELAFWSFGVAVLNRFQWSIMRKVINPSVVTLFGCLLFNLTGLADRVPKVMLDTCRWVGAGAIPLAVFCSGALIASVIGTAPFKWKTAFAGAALRMILLPLLFVGLAKWLPISLELKRVVVVQSVMPSAFFCIVLARLYDGHVMTAINVVITTSLISLLTLPVVLNWALTWVLG